MKRKLYITNILELLSFSSCRKLILITLFLSAFSGYNIAQNDTIIADISKKDTAQTEEIPKDTSSLKIGSKIYKFTEYEDRFVIDRIDLKTGERKRVLDIDDENCNCPLDTNKFRGHWSGFEYGLTNFVNHDYAFESPAGYDYMNLMTFSSWNINFNFAQSSTPFYNNHVGMVSGLGLDISFYRFQGKNSIGVNDSTGLLEERIITDEYDVMKSKFRTTYLTAPLLLEAQFGSGSSKERFYISGGLVGGLRLATVTKIVHKEDGQKKKIKERGNDLNINKWRWGVTARMGYQDQINVYATYYITPFFDKNKGPELYPLSIGFRLNF